MTGDSQDERLMQRALELALQGRGFVEPNPMVGCVIARDGEILGEGFHTAYGAAHAEVEALRQAGAAAAGACMYLNLEPCCHQGKTPPCSQAIVEAGLKRVVVATSDPFHRVAGAGLTELEAAGIEVVTQIAADAARRLNAPSLYRQATGLPWVMAKWAMTLDGKLATGSGESRWISGERSREIVHRLRGRVDAIAIGSRTALADDPLLTARPPGPRVAVRIVLDTAAALSPNGQLARSAGETPVLVVTGSAASKKATEKLSAMGCEILELPGDDPASRLRMLLVELGRRGMTNLLVEGGARLLGSFLDAGLLNEVHAFVAPVLVGGQGPSAIGGNGAAAMAAAWRLNDVSVEQVGSDMYLQGRIRCPESPEEAVGQAKK